MYQYHSIDVVIFLFGLNSKLQYQSLRQATVNASVPIVEFTGISVIGPTNRATAGWRESFSKCE